VQSQVFDWRFDGRSPFAPRLNLDTHKVFGCGQLPRGPNMLGAQCLKRVLDLVHQLQSKLPRDGSLFRFSQGFCGYRQPILQRFIRGRVHNTEGRTEDVRSTTPADFLV
jgi:hypothetical protein